MWSRFVLCCLMFFSQNIFAEYVHECRGGIYCRERVHAFHVEPMPYKDLKPEHVQSWRHIYLWLDDIEADRFKTLTGFEYLPVEIFDGRVRDAVDYKLLPGSPNVYITGLRSHVEDTVPEDHIPGLVTEKNFADVIRYSYTNHFFGYDDEDENPSKKKFIGTAAVGGFRYMQRHLIILRPVFYKYKEDGTLVKKAVNFGTFYNTLAKHYENTLSEEERANLFVPQNVSFRHVKPLKFFGKRKYKPVTQPHLIYIDRLAPNFGLEVRSVNQELAIEASDQLVQQDLRMFFFSVTNMAYWINRKYEGWGLHRGINQRQELNFVQEIFRLLETRHKVTKDGKEMGYISAHLKHFHVPFFKEMREYWHHRNPKDQMVRNKAVELNIRKACRHLDLECGHSSH